MSNLERRTDRFSSLDWFEYIQENKYSYRFTKVEAAILGAGGIGSWLSLLLGRIGIPITIIDFDTVEELNAAGQLYGISSIGKRKVDAIKDVIDEFCGEGNITRIHKKLTAEDPFSDKYVFAAFDNMEARKVAFDSWMQLSQTRTQYNTRHNNLFIDGRLLAEQFTIFCVTPENADRYREYLFSDAEVPDISCTMKQTSHVAAMIASFMVSYFTNHLSNVKNDAKVKSVPFKTDFFIPLNMMEVNE